MQFCVLGPVTIAAGGTRAVLRDGRRRTILAVLLATEGAVVATDRLIDAVWGVDAPPSARKSLQSHVSRLRGELEELAPGGAGALVGQGDGYRVDLTAHDLDATTFAALLDRARSLKVSEMDETIALFGKAEQCWYGPAFGDLATHPALRTKARHLEVLRTAATAARINAWLARGWYDEAVGELTLVVEREPFDEAFHGQLMRALAGAGRQADALATYQDLRLRLREELGIDPSRRLRQLHEDILRQDTAVTETVALHLGIPEGRQLRADPLLGRDQDIETLTSWLHTRSLLTLTGAGGVGKTRLAETLVQRVGSTFRDGVASCALAHVRNAQGVGDALITALGIQPTGEQTVPEALQSALADRHLLVFLDNCEHVLDAVATPVSAILAECPDVTVLATSRERLRLPREYVWPVAPLDVPASDAGVDGVATSSAGALFSLRAAAVDPAFTLTDRNAAAVGELCRRLDGMPLAIELAAARTSALSPAALVERLDQRFAVLAGGPRYEGGRHRTLEAVVEWSYGLLAPAEADLFDRLAVFAGAFPLAAVEQVCVGDGLATEDVAGLLGELVDKSMVVVQRSEDEVRYRLLETMREFGTRRLGQRGALEAVRRAHAAYHVAVAEINGARIRGSDERLSVTAFDAALDDLRAAHAWSVSTGDLDAALRIPAALGDEVFFRLRDEVTTWARRALNMSGAAAHPIYSATLVTAAMGATSRDECQRAKQEATRALTEAGSTSTNALLALGALATVALYEGRLDDALELARRQANLATEMGDDYRLAFAGVCRVLAHLYRGEQAEAAAHVVTLRQVAESSGTPTMRAFARYCDGEVHLDSKPDQAATNLQEAVELARSVDNQLVYGVSLVCLASLQGRRGRTGEALRLFRQVVAHWRGLGDHTHQLTALRNLVELLAQLGEDASAAILYGAVTAGDTPTFGAEAERLSTAWQRVRQRLGAHRAEQLAEQGHQLEPTRVGEEALTHLDALLHE